jgi:hypothetical protein
MLLTNSSILLSISFLGLVSVNQVDATLAQTAPEVGDVSAKSEIVVQKKPSIIEILSDLRSMKISEKKEEKNATTLSDVIESTKKVAEEPKTITKVLCKDCNANEVKTLEFLQERGIKDRQALATILGNIKQESMFVSNVCEGGARIPYQSCRSGGYGIIQWTSSNRYYGLGSFANRYGGNPSTIDTQLRYMVTEPQWRRIEPALIRGGDSVGGYMRHAYSWLGWGVQGARAHYSYGYLNKLYTATVEVEENKDTEEVEVPKVIKTFATSEENK